jgi:phosphate transport system ATP-binding protein
VEGAILKTEDLSAFYGDNRVINSITISFIEKQVTAIMGPSGCGKSTLIRCFNRMHELIPETKVEGKVYLRNEDIYEMEPTAVRRKIGMVFQKPNPFPTMSIYNNVIAGYKLNSMRLKRSDADRIVEESLVNAGLWNEVKDYLHRRGTFLSGGQQQRLCIARTLAMYPEVLLLDEPTSALDPKATLRIEELIVELKKTVTIILVTHNIGQASRVSDFTAFIYLGNLIEMDTTEKIFTVPKDKRTEEYLIGKFG